MKPWHFAAAVCLALVPLASYAAEKENVLLDEITVRGKTEPTREENLTIREVRESSAKDLGEALRQVEGLDYVRKGAIANDVVIRGFQKDNINVFVDGVRLHGACPNRMDSPAFHFDFAEIEDVKVIKGPYDLTNPGGIGGSVDAETKRPHKGFGSEISATGGSYESVNTSATVSYGADRFDGLAGYAYKYSRVPKDGNGRLITDIYPSGNANGYRPQDIDSRAYDINTGWGKVGFNPTDDSRTELSYSYQDAGHVLYPYLTMDANYDRTNIVNLNYRAKDISPLVKELKLQSYWDKVDHLMDNHLRKAMFMRADARTRTGGAKANASLAAGPGTLKSGIDYYLRNWDVTTTAALIPDVYVDNFGLFAEYELPVSERVRLKGGIRGDLTWANAERDNSVTALRSTTDFGEVSGNLQLTWTPVDAVEVFTGIARSVRPPDPQELFSDRPGKQAGNPDLKPVANHEADLGVKYTAETWYAKASLFYSDISDYINLYAVSSTLRSFQNVDATIWGAEAISQVALPFDLFLKGSLSYTEGRNNDGHRPLSEIPPLRGMVSLRYDNNTAFFEVAENLARRQDRVDTTLDEDETAGWATTDLKAGAKYRAFSLYAGINNLFDRFYYSHLSYQRDPFAAGVKVPENGRNFYVTMTWSF